MRDHIETHLRSVPPTVGKLIVDAIARLLNVLRPNSVTVQAVRQLPRLADKLQRIVINAPGHVHELEAHMDDILNKDTD